jgi:type I restriction enzyme S subunit
MSWQKIRLGDHCSIGRGSSPRPINDQRYFENGNIPWVKIADATASVKYILETKYYVNDFGASFSRKLPPETLIVAASGTLGFPMFLGVEACIHDGWLYIDEIRDISKDFLYYKLITLQSYFTSKSVGAAIQNINTDILRDTEICIPSIVEQENIVSVLKTYDDTIENNRRRMELLEESARQLYQEWFVRFRFPGYEHTKVVKGVPEGWARKQLVDICDDIRDTVSPNDMEPATPYIGLEHMPRRSISLSHWGNAADVSSTKLKFCSGDILFGKIRPYFHKVGIAFINGVASSDMIVIRPNSPEMNSLILMTVSSDFFVAQAAQTMREGSKMPRADWKLLKQYPVSVPPVGLLSIFNNTVSAITGQLKVLTLQNIRLCAARDLLLPKLMSGEIEV